MTGRCRQSFHKMKKVLKEAFLSSWVKYSGSASLLVFALMAANLCFSQSSRHPMVLTDFTMPDSVCAGQAVTIQNNSQTASSYYWSFCTADAGGIPSGQAVINTFLNYSQPAFAALVRDNGIIYSFITNAGTKTLIRNNHGTNLLAPVVASDDLGNLGGLTMNEAGIQVLNDNGHWYGFIANEGVIIRLDFRASLQNTPTVISFSGISDTIARFNGLIIVKDKGKWVGFSTNLIGNSLHRFFWGDSLKNPPGGTILGNIGRLNAPYQCTLIKQDSNWFMLVCNSGDSSISRLSFGTSLVNIPTGENLGKLGILAQNRGIAVLRDCEAFNGLIANNASGSNPLIRMNFLGGISGTITGQQLGNIGSLNQPGAFSDFLRIGDTIYTLLTNSAGTSVSVLYFPSCTNASIPSSILRDPPPVTWSTPGTYNVRLVTNEGLADQESVCKPIRVITPLTLNIGNDTTVCAGNDLILGLKAPPVMDHFSFLWNTGDTTFYIHARKPGAYWMRVTNKMGCQTSDTIQVSQLPPVTGTTDTLLCYGQTYFAGGAWQTQAGIYYDTIQTIKGCDSVHISNLSYKPEIKVNIGRDTVLCPGESVTLHANVTGGTFQWQDGSTDSVFTATGPGIYWLHVVKNKCLVGDTLRIGDCPARIWIPSAFTPNGDGLNDELRGKGISIGKFHMEVYSRSGQRLFVSDDIEKGWNGTTNGQLCPADVYSYIVTYETTDTGESRKVSGTFTLVR